MRVLVSGFRPFGGDDVNPSEAVLDFLPAEAPATMALATTVLPVRFADAWPRLLEAVTGHGPDLVLALGQAGGATGVVVEQIAVNLDGPDDPDEDGVRPVDEPIVAGAPLAYASGIPVRDLVARLRGEGVVARHSRSAGAHLCNHVFYRLCHLAATERPGLAVGFVHLPYLPGQVLDGSDPSVPVEVQARSVGRALRLLPRITGRAADG